MTYSFDSLTIDLPDEEATLAAGHALAQCLQAGMTVYLQGDLGAGKTTLSRGLLRGLGHQGRVKSPTYTLVEPYSLAKAEVYHFDLYRFADPDEWFETGFDEYFHPQSLVLIEWPDKAAGLTPPPDLTLSLAVQNTGRVLQLFSHTDTGRTCLNTLSI